MKRINYAEPNESIRSRFWRQVEVLENGCFSWVGRRSKGYGYFYASGITESAYRFAYLTMRGEIPKGLCLDHLCRRKECVNPWHLEIVTNRENTLRGIGPAAMNAKKTHCIRGHELSGYNIVPIKKGNWMGRYCRICSVDEVKRWRARRTEKRREAKQRG